MPGRGEGSPIYDERLRTPWWWYPVALAVAAILAAEFRLADNSLTVWIPFGVLLPASALIVWSMGRYRVQIRHGELRVRDAHLPLSLVSAVVPLQAGTLRRLVGRHGDPLAFVSIRGWVGPGVQVVLDDPEDPVPYWVISTRRPDELTAAIRAAQRAG